MATGNALLDNRQQYFTDEEKNSKKDKEPATFVLKEGMNHHDVVDLKIKLNWIGYGKSKTTSKFGTYFEKQVRRFQSDYQLPVSGLVDDMTKEKIAEVFTIIYSPGSEYNKLQDLMRAFKRLGFAGEEESNEYNADIENRLMEFQRYYELMETGELNSETLYKLNNLLASPLQLGKEHKNVIKLKRDLNSLGYGRIRVSSKFGKRTEKKLKKFQEHYGLPVSGIADKVTLDKIKKAQKIREKITYSNYDVTLDEALNMEQNAIKDEQLYPESLHNPNSLINDDKMKFLFLDLFRPNVVTASVLNKFLEGKGIIEGNGQAFIDAGNEWGINELFLLSHALMESTEGFISKGVETPVNEEGVITYTEIQTNGDKIKLPGITSETDNIVYNMYGNATVKPDYVKRAFDKNWVTTEKAIIGGTEQIMDKYYSIDNTLYKMYSNPSESKENTKQKSVPDFDWIIGKMETLYKIYQQLDAYTLYLEIPVYKDQPFERYIRG
ncbi:peptidoglycan-binding protein [Virgibacillus ainsalahensis]